MLPPELGARMQRRNFITLLSGTVVALPLSARAQQPRRLPTVGYMGSQTRSDQNRWTDAFVQKMRELGWVDGSTVTIQYRWAEGSGARAAEIAAEFARLKVDVIVTNGTTMIIA